MSDMQLPDSRTQLTVLQATMKAVASAKSEDDRLRAIFDSLKSIGLNATHRCRLYVVDHEKTKLVCKYTIGDHGPVEFRRVTYDLRPAQGITGWVFKNEKSVRLSSLDNSLHHRQSPNLAIGVPDIKSLIAMPIQKDGEVVGVLAIDCTERNGFGEDAADALEPFAFLIASAVETPPINEQDNGPVPFIARSRQQQVLVLGKDYGEELKRLTMICDLLKKRGFKPLLVKDHPDIPELSNEEKVRVFADHCRFVVLENSFPAGQIAELKICATNRIITATVREKGCGSSYMVTDYFMDFDFIKEFEYDGVDLLDGALEKAMGWAEQKTSDRARYYNTIYPWRAMGPERDAT